VCSSTLPPQVFERYCRPHMYFLCRARWWSTDSVGTSLMTSADNVTWTVVRDDLKPDNLPSYDFDFDPPLNVSDITWTQLRFKSDFDLPAQLRL
jgi:hypothetical protein